MGKLIEKQNGKLPKSITVNGVNKASLKKIARYTFSENYISLNEKNYQLFFLINEKASVKEAARFEKFWRVPIKIVDTSTSQQDQPQDLGTTGINIATMKKIALYIFGEDYIDLKTKKNQRFILEEEKESQFVILNEKANKKEIKRFEIFWGVTVKTIS